MSVIQNKIKNIGEIGELLTLDMDENLANLQLPDPSLLMYYKNKEDRIIWIDKDIDDTLLEECKQIIRWNMEDKKAGIKAEDSVPIKIFIESYGGQLDVAFAIIDLMKMSKVPIITIGFFAMSAACLIFMNGHMRYVVDKTVLLLHEGSSGVNGTFNQMESSQKNYKELINMMKNNVLEHSEISTQLYNKHKKEDWYIYCDEALKLGIADKKLEDLDDIV